jgi:peptidoglycan biosynthesis protein MviN/MurJ (putative lipid II flippase)
VPFSVLFYAFEDAKGRFVNDFSRFLVGILMMVVLVPSQKQYGAAWGIVIAQLFSLIYGLIILWPKVNRLVFAEKKLDKSV